MLLWVKVINKVFYLSITFSDGVPMSEVKTNSKPIVKYKFKSIAVAIALVVSGSVFAYAYYKTQIFPTSAAYGEDPDALNGLKDKPEKSLTAGDLTHFQYGPNSFTVEAGNLPWGLSKAFDEGDGFFERAFNVADKNSQHSYPRDRDGLGPLFNGDSCESCHFSDGRAAPPQKPGEALAGLLLRVSVPGKGMHGGPNPHPIYGGQLADKAIEGHKPEVEIDISYETIEGKFADGESYSLRKPIYTIVKANYGDMGKDAMISPRVGPHVAGLGLLDALADKTILENADPDDKDGDGISGKPNMVWDVAKQKMSVGKYGWKAETPTIRQQSADAAVNDMGVTNPQFTMQNCTDKQMDCQNAIHGTSGNENEMTVAQLEQVTTYLEFLSIPGRDYLDNPDVQRGEQLFVETNCNACHRTDMVTGTEHRRKRLQNQKISPYTDLLLHNMGEGLADHRPSFDADGYEWRTAPLWGIGMVKITNGHTNFMHDGRARSLSEAILWHGGEAEKAKQKYVAMSKQDRESLVKFLKSI